MLLLSGGELLFDLEEGGGPSCPNVGFWDKAPDSRRLSSPSSAVLGVGFLRTTGTRGGSQDLVLFSASRNHLAGALPGQTLPSHQKHSLPKKML